VAEFFDRYSDVPAEVVNGEVVIMSPNQRDSMTVAEDLFIDLRGFVKEHNLGVVSMETAFVLDADPRTDWVRGARQPDVAFVARERAAAHDAEHGRKGPWRLAPDLAAEVVSPTDKYSDIMEKVADYLRYGVQLVWLISPEARSVRIFTPDDPDGHTLHASDTLSADPVIPGWSMPVARLFEGG